MNLNRIRNPLAVNASKLRFTICCRNSSLHALRVGLRKKNGVVSRILSLNILLIIIALIGKNLKNLNLLILKHLINFFTRELKVDARPIVSGSHELALPADGCVSESGNIDDNRLIQAKGHLFTLEDLLAGDTKLAEQFKNGVFLTTYLSPHDYHRVHMPCAGTLRKMIYVPGELFSVNPFLAQHIPNLFARNERVICVFDTEFGAMAQILVGATVTASMSTVWHGVVNPPRPNRVQVWEYPSDGVGVIRLAKGAEMGAFRLGSTVVNVFPTQKIALNANLVTGMPTKMGELLGTYSAK